jgi:6-phosphofructokinase 1
VVKAATRRGWEIIGFEDGFEGMLEPPRYRRLTVSDLDGLLFRGGTILGTTNRGLFAAKVGAGEVRQVPVEILAQAKRSFESLGLRCLVVVGGDGTLTIAQQLYEQDVPVMGVPKTIDNDLQATDVTFGFDSAVSCAVEALDRLHTTAQSLGRVMVLEVMGRYAGWIAGYAGLAGGADVILIPEMPFNYESILAKIADRHREGKDFTVVIVAEGAHQQGGEFVTQGLTDQEGELRLGGIGAQVAEEIERRSGQESRVVVLGYLQRGGMPTPVDRHLCTRFGVGAVEFIAREWYGNMTALKNQEICPVPIKEAVGKLRTVPPEGELVRTARALGISFGCEI